MMITFNEGDRVLVDGAEFARVRFAYEGGDPVVVRMEEDRNQHTIAARRLTLVDLMGRPEETTP